MNFIMIGQLHIEALDRLRVRLNVYLVIITIIMSVVSIGTNFGRVTSGPAANWAVEPAACRRMFPGGTLNRRMRRTAARSFFSHNDVRLRYTTSSPRFSYFSY